MQRMRVRLLGRFARRILPVIRKGFAGVGKGTAYNAFMAAYMKQVKVDEDMKILKAIGFSGTTELCEDDFTAGKNRKRIVHAT